ncbi:MAG: glycine--tRNA ligase subunit beta [Pseudomonadota bacterium]
MHANKADFLVEIHTEELPPKALQLLGRSFLNEIQTRLRNIPLEFKEAQFFVTPRRLAVLVKSLVSHQPQTIVERRGPALAAAFDTDGNPTPACMGFAKSLNVTPNQLITIQNKQGTWVGFQQVVPGKTVAELLPGIVKDALAALPIPKRMRWGDGDVEFARPVHSVIMLYGDEIIDAEILSVRSGRLTRGHRFHSKKIISIPKPAAYQKRLKANYVIADFAERRQMILEQAQAIVAKAFGEGVHAVIDADLLDEVTGLVEWPVAILGDFDQRFLDVPAEALISAMQDHQRYFPVVDNNGKLLPHFVAISNIEARDMQHMIAGNERVLRARLSDAAFFFEMDKKQKLADRIEGLKHVVYHVKLGTLHEKAVRLSALAEFIANKIGVNSVQAARAGLLAKTDLLTQMVGEFPELQGVAGKYYALQDKETDAIANALQEQYMPRFSGDELPASELGAVLALADRVDTLVGAFGINQQPTGDKDPFALKRAALGVLRILIEKKIDIDIAEIMEFATQLYTVKLNNPATVTQLCDFLQERLKPWYQEQGINPDVIAAVAALKITRPYDFHRRVLAVKYFKELPDAESLSVANKRVSNILDKYDSDIDAKAVDVALFELPAERALAAHLDSLNKTIEPLFQDARYIDVLSQLANLRQPVDEFFDKVMVMAEDRALRENRLLLLTKLRALFLQVADVALLQTR